MGQFLSLSLSLIIILLTSHYDFVKLTFVKYSTVFWLVSQGSTTKRETGIIEL